MNELRMDLKCVLVALHSLIINEATVNPNLKTRV